MDTASGDSPTQRVLVTPGEQTEYIGLAAAELGPGQRLAVCREEESVIVVLSGVVEVRLDGGMLGVAGGRRDVFERPGYAIYVPPRERVELMARTPTELVETWAPLDGGEAAPVRIIGPNDQRLAQVGSGNWSRSVRTILGPEHAAGRLLLGETINPPGNWSSYPPHKHDRQAPPDEVRLEEVYFFKVDPPEGFGVQIRYDDDGEELFLVRDGDVAAIRSGYHPVVAAPGYSLYYLWVMAGEGRQMIPFLDPRYAWIQQSGGSR
ncbi:MAG: 5-deoxy-glucuronate isomerase [Acidothermus sp.]|nr:5-deoxy-glucuronate isomerase [Acidothermus sp.]